MPQGLIGYAKALIILSPNSSGNLYTRCPSDRANRHLTLDLGSPGAVQLISRYPVLALRSRPEDPLDSRRLEMFDRGRSQPGNAATGRRAGRRGPLCESVDTGDCTHL